MAHFTWEVDLTQGNVQGSDTLDRPHLIGSVHGWIDGYWWEIMTLSVNGLVLQESLGLYGWLAERNNC